MNTFFLITSPFGILTGLFLMGYNAFKAFTGQVDLVSYFGTINGFEEGH